MKVILGPPARADLGEIARWIARDNPARASSFVDELEAKCAGLAIHPLRFPVVRQGRGFVVRKRVHGSYLIFYRLGETHVEVMRIVHSARDWATLFDSEQAAPEPS
jgi:toxin ParE1/3/4